MDVSGYEAHLFAVDVMRFFMKEFDMKMFLSPFENEILLYISSPFQPVIARALRKFYYTNILHYRDMFQYLYRSIRSDEEFKDCMMRGKSLFLLRELPSARGYDPMRYLQFCTTVSVISIIFSIAGILERKYTLAPICAIDIMESALSFFKETGQFSASSWTEMLEAAEDWLNSYDLGDKAGMSDEAGKIEN